MRLFTRLALIVIVLGFGLSLVALPTHNAQALAGKQITITITEAQLNKYLPTVRSRNITSLSADIIDGGIIVKIIADNDFSTPEYYEHFGVLIHDGKLYTEAGVISIPGQGGLGYEYVKQFIPELIPVLDHNASVLHKYIVRQITAKAGRNYKPESVVTGNDQIVIVVSR